MNGEGGVVKYAVYVVWGFAVYCGGGGVYVCGCCAAIQSIVKRSSNFASIFRKHMSNEYKLKITEGGGTTMGQEFGVAMHATDTNTEKYSLTEAVTKYAERATRAEANMAEMEAKIEERFAMLSMTAQQPQTYTPPPPQYPAKPQPMQAAYLTTPPPHRSYHHPQLSMSPTHNNHHHISNTTWARKDVKDKERGARGRAPTIGSVINHMEAEVEEA